jgi:hypothetical protein
VQRDGLYDERGDDRLGIFCHRFVVKSGDTRIVSNVLHAFVFSF